MKILRVTSCLFIPVLFLAAMAFVAVHPAAAQGLNPPPPQGANCNTTGQGTICQGSAPFSENFDTGLSCGSFDILQSDSVTDRFTIFYDQAGNVTQAIFHDRAEGTFSNSVTGTSVTFEGTVTQTDTFATPGDFSTMTATFTGDIFKVTLPGSGLILHDVGRAVFAPDGTITFEAGPHQLLHGQVDKLCAALS